MKQAIGYLRAFLGYILICLLPACASRQLSDAELQQCLARTDFSGHDAATRTAIAWLIDYDTKVRSTRCCALEPRVSVIKKRHDLQALHSEILQRIDTLERGIDFETRSRMANNDRCYRSLADLYHDIMYSRRP